MVTYKKIAVIALTMLMGGCATAYQKNNAWSLTGGFSESEAPGKLTKIAFSGNAYISLETASKFTLYRCAEFAKEKNFSHFILYESLSHAAIGKPSDSVIKGVLGEAPFTSTYILLRNSGGPGTWNAEIILKTHHDIVHPAKSAG